MNQLAERLIRLHRPEVPPQLPEGIATYKVVFLLRRGVTDKGYSLDSFLCIPWPEVLLAYTYESLQAAKVITGKDLLTETNIGTALGMVSQMKMRTMNDAALAGPFIADIDFDVGRDMFSSFIESLSDAELRDLFLDNRSCKL